MAKVLSLYTVCLFACVAASSSCGVSALKSTIPSSLRVDEKKMAATAKINSQQLVDSQFRVEMPLKKWYVYPQANASNSYAIDVPNTLVGGLLQAGPEDGPFDFDPFYGKNMELFNKSDYKQNWCFAHILELGTDDFSVAVLKFDGINYRANLTVNGHVIANETEMVGAFRRFQFGLNANSILRSGLNQILLCMHQSAHDPKEWRNNSTDLGISFDDWAPHPPDLSMGIWRPVSITLIPKGELSSAPLVERSVSSSSTAAAAITVDGLVVDTTIEPNDPQQTAFLNVSLNVYCWTTGPVTVWVDLGYPGLQQMSSSLTCSEANGTQMRHSWSYETEAQLSIPNPKLWWPWQMGPQTMFTATAGFNDASGSGIVLLTNKIGLRQTTTSLNHGGALQIFVNNVPILFRGAGWAPDLFLRSNTSRVWKEMALVRDMGMNGIRLEGKMEYDAFFEAANTYGIMVIPGINCCDGWQNWPQWGPLQYKIAYHSMRDQAKRLAHHPSVIALFIASDSLPPPNVERMYNEALREEAWPNPTISSASQQPSTITGPSGVKMVGPYSWEPPTYWLQDGNGLKDFNAGGAWGFFTEGGPGEAPMTLNSWKRTVPEEHLWNPEHGAMDSWWSAHMGCPWGHFRNLTYYNPPLLARYGSANNAKNYLYKSQAAVYEGIRAYFESYNRNKHKNATGFVQWMMNDALPTHLWHLYDWYLTAGGGYYAAKRSNEAIHAMMSYNDGSVWLINSLFTPFTNVELNVNVYSQNGVSVWNKTQTFTVVPGDATLRSMISVPMRSLFPVNVTFFVELSWTSKETSASGQGVFTNWYWLTKDMDQLDFPASNGFRTPCTFWANFQDLQYLAGSVNLTTTNYLYSAGKTANVTVSNPVNSDTIMFMIQVRLVDKVTDTDLSMQMWNDNFLSLAPGQSANLGCDLSKASPLPGSDVELVVETWNQQVLGPN